MIPSSYDHLDQNHPVLRDAPALRVLSVEAVIETALRYSERYLLDFDRHRLTKTLGNETLHRLFPHLSDRPSGSALERQEEQLGTARRDLLQRVLSFEREDWPDPPINYIERVVLFDARGKVVLRASDNLDSMLFTFPEDARNQLIERLRTAGIPSEVIQKVTVDITQGL